MQARPVSASICTTFGLYLVFVSSVMSAVPVWTNSHSKDNKYINSNNNTSSQGRVRNVKSLTKTITFWFFRQSPALCSAHVFLFCCLFFKWTSAQGLNSYKDPLWKKKTKNKENVQSFTKYLKCMTITQNAPWTPLLQSCSSVALWLAVFTARIFTVHV